MKQKSILLYILLLVNTIHIFSQPTCDFSNYSPSLKCEGAIPNQFLRSSSENVNVQKQKHEDYYSDDDDLEDIKSELIAVTALNLEGLFKNGQILFGNSLSKYLNDIKNEVLKSNPDLRDEVKVYLLQSTMINAFATLDGNVFISLGLLSRLNSEAELASIIAHESGHILEHHVMNRVELSRDLDKLEKERGTLSSDDKLTLRSKRSKAQENEADSISMHLIKNSKYSQKSCIEALEVLSLAHIPLGNYSLDINDFKLGDYLLPPVYYLDSINPITPLLEQNQKFNSHPSINERINKSRDQISSDRGVKFLLVNQSTFLDFVKKCQFELVDLHMVNRNYAEALYLTQSLLQEYPENDFLEVSKLRSLYGISKYQNHNKLHYSFPGISDIQGEAHRLFYLLKYLNAAQLATISSNYLFQYLEENPNNVFIKKLANDLIKDMVVTRDISLTDYLDLESSNSFMADLEIKLNQLDKSYSSRRRMALCRGNYVVGFHKLKTMDLLKTAFLTAEVYSDSLKKFESLSINEKRKIYKIINRNYNDLNIFIPINSKVIIADPQNNFEYSRKRMEKKMEDISSMESNLGEYLTEYTASSPSITKAYVSDLSPNDIEEYNQICQVNKVYNECFNQVPSVEMIPTSLYNVENHLRGEKLYLIKIMSYQPLSSRNHFFFSLVNISEGEIVYVNTTRMMRSEKALSRAAEKEFEKIKFNE